MEKEEQYYDDIKQKFSELFQSKGYKVYFEITANRNFSNKLKSNIPDNKLIIFNFLKGVAPDITGFFIKDKFAYFIIIEVKDKKIKLDHIYQAKKYAELFEAKFAFLVSTEEIPEEIKKLAKAVYPLLHSLSLSNHRITLVHFDVENKSFKDWYPENPFEKKYLVIMFYKKTDLKETSIGETPKDWKIVRLRDENVAKIIMG